MKTLRIFIVLSFLLSTGATVFSLAEKHNHILHHSHIALVSATFILIAVYLRLNAKSVSKLSLDELKASVPKPYNSIGEKISFRSGSIVNADGVVLSGLAETDEALSGGVTKSVRKQPGDRIFRGTIIINGDVTIETISPVLSVADAVKSGCPLSNPFIAALAKNGIYVKSHWALKTAGKAKLLAPRGISSFRDSFAKTQETLSKIGVKLSDAEDADSPIVLCKFPDFDPSNMISITHNKASHLIRLVYCARSYNKLTSLNFTAFVICAAAMVALFVARVYMYICILPALNEAFSLYLIRQAEKASEKRLSYSIFDKPHSADGKIKK
jgi:hypothetical protein